MSGAELRAHAVVLFADMSGSVAMYAQQGDTAGFRLNTACLAVLEDCVQKQCGRVIRRAGDGMLAVFDDAASAVVASSEMQQRVHNSTLRLRQEGVRIRVGVCAGAVVHGEGDIYGDSVNVAARLVSLAGPDEILLSEEVFRALPPDLKSSGRRINDLALRGRPLTVAVYEYMWRPEDATVSISAQGGRGAAVLSVLGDAGEFIVGTQRPKLTIGRADDNDIVIDATVVSRHHADICLRGDKFFLTDRSTNGTYLIVDQGPVLRACREEVNLVGSGRIVPGRDDKIHLRYEIRQLDRG